MAGLGEEFKANAAPSQEMWRKLAYMAESGNDSVLTAGFKKPDRGGSSGARDRDEDFAFTLMQETIAFQQRTEAASRRLDELERKYIRELWDAEHRMDELRENAACTHDGRAVFVIEDGGYVDENGNDVDREEVDPATIRPENPTYKAWKETKDRRDNAQDKLDRVRDHQDKLASGDMSEDELDALEKDLDAMEADFPKTGLEAKTDFEPAPKYPGSTSIAKEATCPTNLDKNAPDMQEPFEQAANGIENTPEQEQPAPAPAINHQQQIDGLPPNP